ncbi:hypothetical protein H1P_4940003 [Hyella patelloides LEGE 07179]|uniref:Uncharacterized protein n=1 Tax=Hyella patelloides LEGE 07179 TaxID=945734 RepID=A0A563VZF1_9CYAN|nr:hypothetical protein H1P_4940003 [Hyella patelloides LEGE 07179]
MGDASITDTATHKGSPKGRHEVSALAYRYATEGSPLGHIL